MPSAVRTFFLLLSVCYIKANFWFVRQFQRWENLLLFLCSRRLTVADVCGWDFFSIFHSFPPVHIHFSSLVIVCLYLVLKYDGTWVKTITEWQRRWEEFQASSRAASKHSSFVEFLSRTLLPLLVSRIYSCLVIYCEIFSDKHSIFNIFELFSFLLFSLAASCSREFLSR